MRRGGLHHTLCSVDSLTDQRDCTAGFGWLLITGRGYCKAGPIAQTSEVTSCQATRGNADCSAPLAGSSTHQCGCTAGFGGPLATGRGCRKAGSITQASERRWLPIWRFHICRCTPPHLHTPRPGLRAKGCLSASERPYDLCCTTWPPGIGHAAWPRRLLIELQLHLAPRPHRQPLHARYPTSCAPPPLLFHTPPAPLPSLLSPHVRYSVPAALLPRRSPRSSTHAARQLMPPRWPLPAAR